MPTNTTQEVEVSEASSSTAIDIIGKYRKMVAYGVPPGAVRRRMIRDRIETDVIVAVLYPQQSDGTTSYSNYCTDAAVASSDVMAPYHFNDNVHPAFRGINVSKSRSYSPSDVTRGENAKEEKKRSKSTTRKVLPTDRLFTLVQEQRWEDVVRCARQYPEDAMYIDERSGWTPLHLVCSFGSAPQSVLSAVISAWPSAIAVRDIKTGETPLHIQCRNSQKATGKVKCLLQGSKKISCSSSTHSKAADCCLIRNKAGQLPLHVACDSLATLSVLKAMVRASPCTVTARDLYGDSPLTNVYNSYISTIPGHLAVARILRGSPNQEGHFLRFWDKVKFLSIEAYAMRQRGSSSSNNKDMIMRQASSLASTARFAGLSNANTNARDIGAPRHAVDASNLFAHAILNNDRRNWKMLQIALTQEPTLVDVADQDGNLPLHILVQKKTFDPKANAEAIDYLLQLRPDSAYVYNMQGRAPLHVAVANGLSWDFGLRRILYAAPSLLDRRDPKTGLFPFMLAASSNKSFPGSIRRSSDLAYQHPSPPPLSASLCSTNTIFRLLRSQPYLVSCTTNMQL